MQTYGKNWIISPKNSTPRRSEAFINFFSFKSRDSGRINKYSLFGLSEPDNRQEEPFNWNECQKRYGKHAENIRRGLPLKFANDAEMEEFLLTELPKLTLLESYPIYEHFIEKLSSPHREIKMEYGIIFK